MIAVSIGPVQIAGKRMSVDVQVDGATERDVVIMFPVGIRLQPASMPKGTQFLLFAHGEGFAALPANWGNAETASEPASKVSDSQSIDARISALESAFNAHVHIGVTAGAGISGIPQSLSNTSSTIVGSDPLEVT